MVGGSFYVEKMYLLKDKLTENSHFFLVKKRGKLYNEKRCNETKMSIETPDILSFKVQWGY